MLFTKQAQRAVLDGHIQRPLRACRESPRRRGAGCTSTLVSQDSWMPSFQVGVVVAVAGDPVVAVVVAFLFPSGIVVN